MVSNQATGHRHRGVESAHRRDRHGAKLHADFHCALGVAWVKPLALPRASPDWRFFSPAKRAFAMGIFMLGLPAGIFLAYLSAGYFMHIWAGALRSILHAFRNRPALVA